MSLFQLIEQVIVSESIMDQETTRLTRLIMRDIVKLFYGDNKKIKEQILEYQSNSFNFPIYVKVSQNDTITKPRAGNARYSDYPEGKEIFLEIEIPKEPVREQLNNLVNAIKGVLRHELEHARQDQRGGTILGSHGARAWEEITDDVWDNPMKALNYFTRPSEIEAYVMQIYKTSKMKKIPFTQGLEEWLLFLEKNFSFKSKKFVISSIRKSMTNYAKLRMPKLNQSI